jgi:hypothetical protein
MFGAAKRAEAANASWALVAIYEKQDSPDAAIRQLRAYLAKYAASDPAREVTAYAKLGEALWQKACPVKLVDGSCVKVEREMSLLHHASTKQCGDATKVKLTVVPRDESTVRAAMSAFASAMASYKDGMDRGALYHYALAKLGVTERAYEKYLALAIPGNLDFTPARAAQSRKRFETWLESKRAVAVNLSKAYADVAALKDGATSIAAASRLGQVFESFSGQLFRAEIPASLRTGPYAAEASQAYCDAVTEAADPLEADATRAFEVCLGTSTRLGWFSESSRVCERELGQLDPSKWPTASELRKNPEAIAPIVAVEGAPQGVAGNL